MVLILAYMFSIYIFKIVDIFKEWEISEGNKIEKEYG